MALVEITEVAQPIFHTALMYNELRRILRRVPGGIREVGYGTEKRSGV